MLGGAVQDEQAHRLGRQCVPLDLHGMFIDIAISFPRVALFQGFTLEKVPGEIQVCIELVLPQHV